MKLMEIDTLPIRDKSMHPRKPAKNIRGLIDEFLDMNVKYAQILIGFGDYKNFQQAYDSIRRSVKNYGKPVKVTSINNELFLVRKTKLSRKKVKANAK